jgi:hypothetical protein
MNMITDIDNLNNNRLAMHANGRGPGIFLETDDKLVSATIREITSRLAIYRKLKDLGHSDDTIFTIYKKAKKEN